MTENTNYIFEELFKAAQPNRGLFVMPLPTGAGKTYNSCQMMAEELKKEDANKAHKEHVVECFNTFTAE